MKKLLLLLVTVLALSAAGLSTAMAGEHEKTVYVIENHKPVKRTVLVDEHGGYYRMDGGRRVVVEHVYETYPDKMFFPDGRVRPGVQIDF